MESIYRFMLDFKLPDQYTLLARYCPAIATSVPIFYSIFFVGKEAAGVIDLMQTVAMGAFGVSLYFVFLYGIAQAGRFIGKMIFERLFFGDETRMPTTNILLYKNKQLSKEYKEKIRAKIESSFTLALSTPAQERGNELAARQKIAEAVALVRKVTPPSVLLRQYNTEYGAGRNLVGGAFLAVCTIGIELLAEYYHPGLFPRDHLVIMGVAYGTIVLCSRWIMGTLGGLYAKTLFQDFLTR